MEEPEKASNATMPSLDDGHPLGPESIGEMDIDLINNLCGSYFEEADADPTLDERDVLFLDATTYENSASRSENVSPSLGEVALRSDSSSGEAPVAADGPPFDYAPTETLYDPAALYRGRTTVGRGASPASSVSRESRSAPSAVDAKPSDSARGGVLTDAIFEAKTSALGALNGLAVQNTYVKVQKTVLKLLQGLTERTDGELTWLRRQLYESEERARADRYRMEDEKRDLERRVLQLERVCVVQRGSGASTALVGSRLLDGEVAALDSTPEDPAISSDTLAASSPAVPVSRGGRRRVHFELDSERNSTPARASNPSRTDPASSLSGRTGRRDEGNAKKVRPNAKSDRAQIPSTFGRFERPPDGDERRDRELAEFALARPPNGEFETLLLSVLSTKNDTYLGRVFAFPLADAGGRPAGFLLNLKVLRIVAKLVHRNVFLVFPRGERKAVVVGTLRAILLDFGALAAPKELVRDESLRPFAVWEQTRDQANDNWLRLPVGFVEAARARSSSPNAPLPTAKDVETEGGDYYRQPDAWPPRRSFRGPLLLKLPPEPTEENPDPSCEVLGAPLYADDANPLRSSPGEDSSGLRVVRRLGAKFNAAMGRPDLSDPVHWCGFRPVENLEVLRSAEAALAVATKRISQVAFAPIKAKRPNRDASSKNRDSSTPLDSGASSSAASRNSVDAVKRFKQEVAN